MLFIILLLSFNPVEAQQPSTDSCNNNKYQQYRKDAAIIDHQSPD